MKIIDNINMYDKDGVFDSYSRIVEDFKDYDNVTRKQMIKEMYKVYRRKFRKDAIVKVPVSFLNSIENSYLVPKICTHCT